MLNKSLLIATVLAATASVTTAHADIQVTPLLGHNVAVDNAKKHQELNLGTAARSDMITGIGVGIDVTDKLNAAVEYTTTRADGTVKGSDVKSDTYFVTTRYTVLPKQDVYVLGGVGYEKVTATGAVRNTNESPVLQVGVGKRFGLTQKLTAKTEVKAIYNVDDNYWVPTALVGLDINFK